MKRQIDILFSCHNGQRTLPRMLGAFEALEAPSRPWRLVAVDNGSTDSTPQILLSWSAKLPIEIHQCAMPGKVKAQQFAAPLLEGELVIFTDDDIVPSPGWLRALEAAADANPAASIFGGAINPLPIDAVSPWYAASESYHRDLFALTQAAAGRVIGADCIFGPNMMLRLAEACEALGRQSVLGPSSVERKGRRVFPLGDETEMIAALERTGRSSVFVPEAQVFHMVRDFQTDLAFMLQRAQNHGRGVAVRSVGGRADLKGRLRHAVRGVLSAAMLWRRAVAADKTKPSREAFDRLYGYNWHVGRAKGALFGPFAD